MICFVCYYISQVGYVFINVCLFICLLAGLRKNYSTDFHNNSIEKSHAGQGRNDQILAVILIQII